jgi:hypothetical protein
MAETIITDAVNAIGTITYPISSITRLIQALGGIILLYLIFSIVNAVINWKKNKEIKKLREDIREIKKILSKKKK